MSRRWSTRGLATLLAAVVVWIASGTGVYVYLASHRSPVSTRAKKPGEGVDRKGPISQLPGTLYMVQDGTLYRLQQGTFTAILNSPGGTSGWTQPAVTPSGQQLVVVRRDYSSSDLYLIDQAGHVQGQLTHDANSADVGEFNHWAFYPRVTPDGGSIFLSWDAKDPNANYDVVMSIFRIPLTGARTVTPYTIPGSTRWTSATALNANRYTGGDVEPIPLANGAMIYTRYTFDNTTSRTLGQLWYTTRPGTVGRALTDAADDCSQPALSPDGQRLAMICTGGKQLANLEIATFANGVLGTPQVLVAGQLAAQPTWAPDGSGLVYFAPTGVGQHFQLWLQKLPPPPTPPPATTRPPASRPATPNGTRVAQATPAARPTAAPTPTPTPAPIQLTPDNDFDATSPIAWHA